MIGTRSLSAAAPAAANRHSDDISAVGQAAAIRRASRFAMGMALAMLAVSGLMIHELVQAGVWAIPLVRLGVGVVMAVWNLGIILVALMLAAQPGDNA